MISPLKRIGRPYPSDYDAIPYPKRYIILEFKSFFGEGVKNTSSDQHLTHFIASCGNTISNDALLLCQFPQNLTGPVVEWYYSLENESIKIWDDMIDTFRAKFTVNTEISGHKRMKEFWNMIADSETLVLGVTVQQLRKKSLNWYSRTLIIECYCS